VSCMEHVCRDCEHEWFDNYSRGSCPECRSMNVSHYFDEDGDNDEPDWEEPEPDVEGSMP